MSSFDREAFNREAGKKMQLYREGKSLTQQEVADALEMPRSTYANIEGGRQRLPADVVWRVAVLVGLPVDRILPKRQH